MEAIHRWIPYCRACESSSRVPLGAERKRGWMQTLPSWIRLLRWCNWTSRFYLAQLINTPPATWRQGWKGCSGGVDPQPPSCPGENQRTELRGPHLARLPELCTAACLHDPTRTSSALLHEPLPPLPVQRLRHGGVRPVYHTDKMFQKRFSQHKFTRGSMHQAQQHLNGTPRPGAWAPLFRARGAKNNGKMSVSFLFVPKRCREAGGTRLR